MVEPITRLPTARTPFTRERLHEIEPQLRADLVKGILPRHGVVFIAGPSTAAKTFLALELTLRISRGEPIAGHRSKEGGVVYVAAEDAEGVRRRLKAWRTRNGGAGQFQMIPEAPDIRNTESLASLRREIGEAAMEMDADNVPLAVVVLDTMSKAVPGADQNSSEDMGAVMVDLAGLATELKALVIVIAHTPKDESRGIAGWYGQFGGSDGVIMLTRDTEDDQLRVATVLKMKNGVDGSRLAFRLEAVEIGRDEDGEVVTSCVVAFEEAPSRARTARPPRLGSAETIALRAVRHILDHGETEPAPMAAGVRPGTQAARITTVRERAFATGFAEDGVARNTRNVRWNRTVEKLVAAQQVRSEGGLIWPV